MLHEFFIYFGRKEKGKWGAVVPSQTGFSSVHLLVIHVEPGHCLLVWLVAMACELGHSTLDESPTVQEGLWPFQEAKSKPVPGEPIMRWFCEN